jgi:hypothetical protein
MLAVRLDSKRHAPPANKLETALRDATTAHEITVSTLRRAGA